jgi:hypothetical protein
LVRHPVWRVSIAWRPARAARNAGVARAATATEGASCALLVELWSVARVVLPLDAAAGAPPWKE